MSTEINKNLGICGQEILLKKFLTNLVFIFIVTEVTSNVTNASENRLTTDGII